ncbi:MAG: iron uptake porin [Cyanobacteria bacterium P01_C01_bin.72]
MDKSNAVSLPLSVTSAILVSHLGFNSPVAAQAIPSTLNFSANFNLTKNHLEFDSFPLKLSSINWHENWYTSDHTNSKIFLNSNLLSKQLDFSLPSFNNNNDRPQVDLEYFKAQADKHSLIPLNTESTFPRDHPTSSRLAKTSLIDNSNHQNIFDSQSQSFNKVSDLKDVSPTDWYYNSLLRLIERYGCFAGFDDNTFRGERSLTRYEFAAALNSCLESIENLVTEEDLPTITEATELNRLTAEFESELSAVQDKTDRLEQKITLLEEQNFSATTILRGQVDLVLASAFGDKKAVPSGETPTENLADEITFSHRTRLNFETSFTGKDLLRTRIEAGNSNAFGSGVTGTQMTFLGVSTNTNNNVRIGQIFYRFPLGEKGNAYIAGARQSASAFVPTLNRASTISLFGFNNPLYDLGFGAGGGVYYQFSDLLGAGLTYFSGSTSVPEPGKGFFNGDYSALGQVTFTPSDNLGISFTYAHFFSPEPGATNNVTSFTGSQFAQLPFGGNTATASDNFNLALSYQVSDRLEIGGWLGYINATAKSSPADSGFLDLSDANADIWTGAITASYNDLGKLGSKLSAIVGVPPKLTSNDLPDRQDNDTTIHIELSYNYPLTERISLKPGILILTNPEHNSDNNSIAIGLLQTTFSF